MSVPLVDDLKRLYHRTWWALLLNGLLALTVGVLVIVRPLQSVAAFALVIALWALSSGFVNVVQAVKLARVVKQWWVWLLSGLAGIGFGLVAIVYYPVVSLAFAVGLLSWWLLFTGALGILTAVQQKRSGLPWGWTAAGGALSVLASAFALISPPAALVTIMGLIAGLGMVSGVVLVAGSLRLRELVRPVARDIERFAH